MNRNRWIYLIISIMFLLFCVSCGWNKNSYEATESQDNEFAIDINGENARDTNDETEKDMSTGLEREIEADPNWEKGYDLAIAEDELEEAMQDIQIVMNHYKPIYDSAPKTDTLNIVLEEESLLAIQEDIANLDKSVGLSLPYISMKNYETFDSFLRKCQDGTASQAIRYEVHQDGTVAREKYVFDGENMYILVCNTSWYDHKPQIAYSSMTRINNWSYTDRGWFAYELCVPEPPEVSEEVDGAIMIRIRPFDERCMEFSKKYIMPISYYGNNTFRCDWDAKHMDSLDFTGVYEFLYLMDTANMFEPSEDADGIAASDYESLIMKYFPVDRDGLRNTPSYNKKKETYSWRPAGNAEKSSFTTSMPEVTDIKEEKDGIYVLTVHAVCDMGICDESLMTHKVTIKLGKNGSFQYLGNEIVSGDEAMTRYVMRNAE